MTVNKKKLAEKVKKINSQPKISKKSERKVRRQIQHLRRELRKRNEQISAQTTEWLDEELERQRIIREVEAGETKAT